MSLKWEEFKTLAAAADEKTLIPFTEFKIQATKNKKGEIVERLTPVKQNVTVQYIICFMEELLPEITHHRNMLKLYRNTIKIVMSLFGGLFIDIDFSQNLTLAVKYEPQSLRWVKEQISVHSGIVKVMARRSTIPMLVIVVFMIKLS